MKPRVKPGGSLESLDAPANKKGPPTEPRKRRPEVMTLQQAIAEYGEEFGPIMHRLANSNEAKKRKKKKQPWDTLTDFLQPWADRHKLSATLIRLQAGPHNGSWQFAGEKVRAAGAAGEWSIVVVMPGEPPILSEPALPIPGADSPWPAIDNYARALGSVVMRYWGGQDNASEISWRTRKAWNSSRALPADREVLRAALHMYSNVFRQLGVSGSTENDRAYIRALLVALRSHSSNGRVERDEQ